MNRLDARADEVRALFVQTPASLTGNFLGILGIVAIFAPLVDDASLWLWAAIAAVLWLIRLLHWLRWHQSSGIDAPTLLRWRLSWSTLVLLQGAMWGLAAWLFYGRGTSFHLVALLMIVFSYCIGAVQVLASQPRLFVAFTALVLVPAIARIASDTESPFHWQLALVLTLVYAVTAVIAHTYRSALGQAIELKSRTDQLAQRLRVEMAAAESARRAAEAANRAKTQFFAAASHDLRQPLHALGLFAEALRRRSHDPEAAALVNSINESVDALEGLFAELLDITRIDSGGVDVQTVPVQLADVYTRLRLHFEPVAFEKGLLLRFRGGRHVALADPVLLERMLRNLVSNALRYTEDGGVLVSCRTRGPRLRLQVWDSGIGISEAALPRIFDEFYQVQTTRALEPHHRKGLGLGLAIVRRLAELMNAPLSVSSRIGRGTVFSLELPRSREAARPPAASAAPAQPPGLTLAGRLVVVVEDEPAVSEGVVVLLRAWGADVLAFDTQAAVAGWAASPAFVRPALLILDYRLPDGVTGVDVLTELRRACAERFGAAPPVPAIVVTGSTLGGHEQEAGLHDFHLMIKPVLPARLRAMVAFKLRLQSG